MKTKLTRLIGALALLAFSIINSQLSTCFAQGTTFTYQGRLNSGGSPVNGSYDLVFTLYNTNTTGAAIAGPVTNSATAVTNGLFTTLVSFVPGVFTGGSNWLQIAVSTNAANSFSTLAPRQRLTPVPYAVFAGTASNVSGTVSAAQLIGAVASANLSGAYGNAVSFNNAGNSFSGNGGGLVNLNASDLSGGTVADALLSANVPLLNANQTFTGVNTFAGANQGLIVNGGPIGANLFTGLGLQYNPGSGEAAIISSLNDNRSFLTFYTKPGPGIPPQQQMKIDRNGVVMLDDQANNNGVLNDGTTNGVGLVFGGNSGEGIASQRTPGVNQFGLDFYTGRTRQMSILNNGNIGMGVTNPGTALQVSGTVTATSFSGNGAGLTSLTIPAGSITGNMIVNGTISNADLAANSITGDKIVNGTLSNADVAANTFWNTTGNAGTVAGTAFLGTADSRPLEIRVGGLRAGLISPGNFIVLGAAQNSIDPASAVSSILGGSNNTIAASSGYSVIGGGAGNGIQTNADDSFLGGGNGNSIAGSDSLWDGSDSMSAFLGGGEGNSIQMDADHSFLGGGSYNSIQARADNSFLGGGLYNSIQMNAYNSFLGGGGGNSIQTNADDSFLGGGNGNIIRTNASYSFLGGGYNNSIQMNAYDSFLGGGYNNSIHKNAGNSFLGGGAGNGIQANALYSFLGGGNGNSIQAGATNSALVGGLNNSIQGSDGYSLFGYTISSMSAFLGGGEGNIIQFDADHSVLVGGLQNSIGVDSESSCIVGGFQNSIQVGQPFCFIGGGISNALSEYGYGSFLGGGSGNTINVISAGLDFLGGGLGNIIQDRSDNAALCGGVSNSVSGNSRSSFIGGGEGNSIQNSDHSVLGGGGANSIEAPAAFLGGGYNNSVQGYESVIGGGANNTNQGAQCFIGGGQGNVILSGTSRAMILGGVDNFVGNSALNALAAGTGATAIHEGAFVWADAQGGAFTSVAYNEVAFRCAGGVRFTSGSANGNQTVSWNPGSGSWSFTSDRNAKENFQSLDVQAVLAKVAQLPLTEWNYKGYGDRHVGPMAQDFHAAFPFNANDKMLNSADEAGITLAAIQGLNEKLETRSQNAEDSIQKLQAETKDKDAEIEKLKQRLDALEKLILNQKQN